MANFASLISFLLLFVLFATTFNRSILCNTGQEVRCSENDQQILLIFKQGVMDSSNQLSSWTNQDDCCLWEGVQCDKLKGRVTELDLTFHDLQGVINLSLLQLEFLNSLDLSMNNFTSVCIPPCQDSKFALHRDKSNNHSFATSYTPSPNFSAPLHYIDFSWNDIALNDLHWLSRLPSLKYLDLTGNDIGSEPKWLYYVAMLPSLSELRLKDCSLTDFPSYNYVNFSSLKILDLCNNNITSELPNSFFNITKDISYVDLGGNNFHGGLPISLFNLPNLNYLSLSNNKLEGSIPSFVGNISSLTSLDVSYNYLSGNLPKSLGQLCKLSFLSIDGNSWEGVLSEKNFINLSSLKSLYFSSTSFRFDFDPNWVPPFQLEYFGSANTSLGPNFPVWLYTQRSLVQLWMPGSGILTICDADIFWSFIARILDVDLSNNLISVDISNVTLYSTFVNLDYNNFTGGLPHISANVSEFQASHNSFSGSISPLLCHPQSNGENKLYYMDLSYNHLTGILPDCWANWKQLDYLVLQSNKLTGKLPPSMASLDLKALDLRDNNFFGKLDLLNWTNFEILFLDGNEFSGSLPNPHMAQNLKIIKLRSNQFIGNIPSQLCNLPSFTVLDLAENKLSGSIPHCLYNITYPTYHTYGARTEIINIYAKGRELDYQSSLLLELGRGIIDLSANSLSGEIPKELFSINRMHSLNLSRNHLIGKIPKEIGGMKNLESLDLSYNRLSGEIPSTISNLSFLAYLNLSYNNFIGQIPLGTQIQSFDYWSFVGNRELCGDPLPKKCNKKEETQDSKLAKGNEDDNFLKSLYLGMGVGFAVGFWGVCGSLFLIRKWRHKFFRWFDHLVDQLYVAWALCSKSFS